MKNYKKEQKQDSKKSFDSKNFLIYFPLLLICAVIAGIFGETIMRNYIAKDIYSPYSYYNEVNLANINPSNPGFIISEPKNVVVSHDVKISETISNLKSSFVLVFKKLEVPTISDKLVSAENSEIEVGDLLYNNYYYDLQKPLFVGFIITSDGWALAPLDPKLELAKEDLVAIDSNRKIYDLAEISELNDDGLIFFRLNDVKNFPIRKNLAKSDFFLGQSFLALKDLNSADYLTLNTLKDKSGLLSSEDSNLSLGFSLASVEMKNSFVFNLAGDLAVIVNNKGDLIPAFSYNYQWKNLVDKNFSARPFLGVNYLDLSDIKFASSTNDINKGALLFSDGLSEAVIKNSPAEKAGLKEGDIITWVNNYELSSKNDLAEIMSLYQLGDKLNISYLRNNVEQKTELTLEARDLDL